METLIESGFDQQRAKGITASMKRMKLDHVATEHGLRQLEVALCKDIATLRTEAHQALTSIQSCLHAGQSTPIRWFLTAMLAQIAIIAALLSAFQ